MIVHVRSFECTEKTFLLLRRTIILLWKNQYLYIAKIKSDQI